MPRFNTKKPCQCGDKTSVVADEQSPRVFRRASECGAASSLLHVYTAEVYKTEHGSELYGESGVLVVPCRGCGKLRRAVSVRGYFNRAVKCDARCENATGKHV